MRRRVLLLPLLSALLLTSCGADTTSPTAVSGGAPTAAPTVAGGAGGATAPATETPAGATGTTPAAGAPAGSGAAIPIGIAVAQTSNVALLGQEEVTGAQIAEKFFNDRGGVNGTPIKLVYQDTGGDEVGANNAFLALMNKDKVVAIVGPTLSQQAFSADKLANDQKVPVVGPSNTAAGIPQIGDYVARVSAPVSIVAPNAVKAALKIKPDIKKVAVFFAQDDAFSKSETGTFQDTVKSMGLDLVTVQKFSVKDTDFTTQATAALALQPDLAIISGLAADGGNLVKQLRDLGFKGLIIGGNGLNTSNVFPVCKAQCDGVLIAQAYSPEATGDVNAAFRAAYKALKQKEPPQFSAQTFAGVQVVVDALASLDKKSKVSGMALADLRTALNQELLAGKYDTPLGPISFDKEGEVNQTQFYVAQIKMNAGGTDGQFTYLK
jgi:branched-chain amino acid transport system substrate-binding protein